MYYHPPRELGDDRVSVGASTWMSGVGHEEMIGDQVLIACFGTIS